MTKLLSWAAFAAGLAAVGWVGAGYLASHPLALVITLLIAAFYLLGAFELRRFSRATQALVSALQTLSHTPDSVDSWLAPVPAALRNAVRQRIEGARTGLPGPVLASYLTGLLVLLGMLGTFLGMVVTLDGTGAALAGADGLSAIRDALSAPVRGLGLAFGTSVAGVAASAMLGLMTALCRRERIQAVHQLDAAIASTLRPFTGQHQRETSLRLLEQQARLMPDVVERIQACMEALERQQQALNERLAADQARFYRETESAYQGLAASVRQTLAASVADSAAQAGSAIQPAVEATLAGLARESARLQEALAQQVQQQLGGMAEQFGDATALVASQWQGALADHQRTSDATAQALRETLGQFSQNFEQRSSALAEGLAARLEQQSEALSARWGEALEQQARGSEQTAQRHQQALHAATDGLAQHAATLQQSVAQAHAGLQSHLAEQDAQRMAAWTQSLEQMTATLRQEWQQAGAQAAGQWQQLGEALARTAGEIGERSQAQAAQLLGQMDQRAAQDAARLAAWTESLQALSGTLREEWRQSSTHAAAQQQQLGEALARTAGEIGERSQAQAAQLLGQMEQRAAQDAARLAAWTESLQALSGILREEWQQSSAQAAAQQQQWSEALTRAAGDITRQLEVQAQGTLGEVERLVQAASEAPRAAAEVIGELRQKLADSMVRDNALLEERGRILETLSTLLDAVNHASAEQRGAIDALVEASSSLMERASGRFAETLQAQVAQMDGVAAQLTSSAVEVASLGEAFGGAVQLFGQSNEQLVAQLQRIEAAQTKSLARSDEQLEYYVAQAREVIELSIGAQKQIIDDLQQLAEQRGTADAA
ncbi:MAG: DUF802 domain-containing protein [Acidovorax sp.]|nr:DUF802 domain-containing protein [Acidovorax sp.]